MQEYGVSLPELNLPETNKKNLDEFTVAADAITPPNNNKRVAIIHNLNVDKVTCDKLFTLCGAFGDVVRVKLSYANKSTAFVQMATPDQVTNIVKYLSGTTLWGNQLRCGISKMDQIHMPVKGNDENPRLLTKDYSFDDRHRFKQPNSKNYKHIGPPSHILHLSNLPESASETELFQLLGGDRYLNRIQFFNKTNTMAFIHCTDVSAAVELLVDYHRVHYKNRDVRITFCSRSRVRREEAQVQDYSPQQTTPNPEEGTSFGPTPGGPRTGSQQGPNTGTYQDWRPSYLEPSPPNTPQPQPESNQPQQPTTSQRQWQDSTAVPPKRVNPSTEVLTPAQPETASNLPIVGSDITAPPVAPNES